MLNDLAAVLLTVEYMASASAKLKPVPNMIDFMMSMYPFEWLPRVVGFWEIWTVVMLWGSRRPLGVLASHVFLGGASHAMVIGSAVHASGEVNECHLDCSTTHTSPHRTTPRLNAPHLPVIDFQEGSWRPSTAVRCACAQRTAIARRKGTAGPFAVPLCRLGGRLCGWCGFARGFPSRRLCCGSRRKGFMTAPN